MAVAKKRTAPASDEPVGRPATRIGREPIPVPRLVPRGKTAFDTVQWRTHDAVIKNAEGKVIFEQKGIRAPTSWSETSVNIAASKYFRVLQGRRENSIDGMIRRVCHFMAERGLDLGYLDTPDEATTFEESLSYLMVQQMAAFNSPVWFNVGVREPPQCSACFIQSITDDMDSILALATSEGRLFKGGSGTGTNLSPLRGSHERLAGGGIASGPVSFMRAFDALAGVIKSGGTTRRAAKMVILNMDHPDIVDFIDCKVREEDKAAALIREGYSVNFDGTDPDSAYASIAYQNANHSVRVPDAFMEAVVRDKDWKTFLRTDHSVSDTYPARELWRKLAYAAWRCGDPGVQFDDVTNDWHTCPNSGRINASNPCSEYLFLDDSACNLASINLMRFLDAKGLFDIEQFRQAVRTMTLAMEIIVDASSYPTAAIAQNSHDYRPLGLGYANLGALLMHYGLAYDSDAGRTLAASVSAFLSAEGYHMSSEIAKRVGPFPGFERNRAPMLRVMGKHARAAEEIPHNDPRLTSFAQAAVDRWHDTVKAGELWGYRNAQVSVIAPTGDDRAPHGLRHARPRARALARQGEEPGRRRRLAHGQPDRAERAPCPRLLPRRDPGHHGAHREDRDDRGRPRPRPRGPHGLRLRARPRRRRSDDSADGASRHARRGPAVPFGWGVQDDQPPERGDRRGHREDLPRGVEARHQVGRALPGRLQGVPTVRDGKGPSRRSPGGAARPVPGALARTSGRRSRITSRSAGTTGTSPSGSIRTDGPVNSSSGSRKRGRPSTASWIRSGSRCPWPSSTGCRSKTSSASSPTFGSSPPGRPTTRGSVSRSRSPTTWLAGSRSSS